MPTLVLLVDPDECIVAAFARKLANRGFETLTASIECDCMRHLCESAPEVVVLEPDGHGSWGRKILSSRDGSVPFVVVSRFSRDDSNLSDETQWLTKPVALKDLAAAVYEAAEGQSTVR